VNRNAALPTFRLPAGTSIAQAEPWQTQAVTLDSPAESVMTDLSRVKAATVQPATQLRQAEQAMIYLGVRMLFVVSEMPQIEGLVTTTDLHGDRQMRLVHERGLHWDELTVADVMTGLSMLDAVPFAAMRAASVGDLVATLKRFGRNHLLVVEADGTNEALPQVRGVISRSQIERQTGLVIDITPIATTFAEIERALA
jgi:CBS-domain-containing membrane protein